MTTTEHVETSGRPAGKEDGERAEAGSGATVVPIPVLATWTEPGSYPLLPPSTQCNKPVEHSFGGVTLTFYCGLAPGHDDECGPRDAQGRDPRDHPYYQAPADVEPNRAARRTARAKVEKPAEAENAPRPSPADRVRTSVDPAEGGDRHA